MPDGYPTYGQLPLHCAALHGASVAVVGRLLQQYPHAAAAKTAGALEVVHGCWSDDPSDDRRRRGFLPLHLALIGGDGDPGSQKAKAQDSLGPMREQLNKLSEREAHTQKVRPLPPLPRLLRHI